MKRIILIYTALFVLGISAMPNVATIFANQHSFYKAANIKCITCHSDVSGQLEINSYVNVKHKEAALDHNYTTHLTIGGISYDKSTRNITVAGNYIWYWNGSVWINSSNPSQYRNESLDNNGNGEIDGDEICMLCHSSNLLGAEINAATVVVSAGDDDRCHGNRNFIYNDPELLDISSSISAAGYNISIYNIHSSYYLTESNQSSRYPDIQLFGYTHGNTNGTYISRGYFTCLGCHSEVSTNVTLVLAQTFNHSDISAQKGRY